MPPQNNVNGCQRLGNVSKLKMIPGDSWMSHGEYDLFIYLFIYLFICFPLIFKRYRKFHRLPPQFHRTPGRDDPAGTHFHNVL